MPERRLLEATELFAALPRGRARPAPGARRRSARSTATRCCSTRATSRTSCSSCSRGRIAIATPAGDGRESLVAVLEAGGLFGELGLFDEAPRSADARALDESHRRRARVRARARACSTRTRAAVGDPAHPVAAAAQPPTRRSPTRCSSTCPRRTAKRLLELAGDQDAVPLPHDPGGARRARRRVTRAGEQGAVAVHPPRLDRDRGPQPLPHPRPPGAAGPRHALDPRSRSGPRSRAGARR